MNKRLLYIDILNIFACFAVISLHHNGIVHSYDVHKIEWAQALFFEVVFYWAVPVFFMITGVTLIGYREKYTTKYFFIKRVSRAFIPFLIWSIILLCIAQLTNPINLNSWQDIVNIILTTKVRHGDVYWFFIPLFSVYLAIPVLSLLKDNRDILWYVVILSFITTSCLPLLFYSLGLKYNSTLQFPMNTAGYLLFVILGYLISTTELNKTQRVTIYLLGIASAFLRYSLTYKFSLSDGKLNKILFSYTQFHSVFLALAIFVFIQYSMKYVEEKLHISKKIQTTIRTISSCSLGIYLIHKLVMANEINLFKIEWDNFYWRFFGMFLTYAICLLIVYSVKKVPLLNKLFP